MIKSHGRVVRICILFSPSDIELFSDFMGADCILFGDNACHSGDEGHVYPQLHPGEENELVAKVYGIFKSFEQDVGLDSIKGFANNLYECSVAPLCAYIKTLDRLLSELNLSNAQVEVWFPSKIFMASRGSAYYLAEHESQGQHLYSREATFLPYLEEVCGLHGATIKYKKFSLFGLSATFNRLARTTAVFIWRLSAGFVAILRKSKLEIGGGVDIDMLAVTRAMGQTEFIAPFLESGNLKIAFLAGEATLAHGGNRNLVNAISLNHSNLFGVTVDISIFDLAINYIKALLLMVSKPPVYLETSGVKINLDQAMTEVLVIWPDLMSYRSSLSRAVRKLGSISSGILLTTEQKSPQAHADAWVAAENGLTCIQIMQCDQHARPLPYPIFGNFFLADSIANARKFSKAWGENGRNVRYIGSFKARNEDLGEVVQLKDANIKWCFFSQVDDVVSNIEVLKALRGLKQGMSVEIFVKLHPRDSLNNYRDFLDFTFLAEGVVRKSQLFSSFDCAITFPSGVVLDLIFRNKPFLLLRFGKWGLPNYSYIDHEYVGNIFEISQLGPMVQQSKLLFENFKIYQDCFFRSSGVVSDAKTMWGELLKLHFESKSNNQLS